MPPADPRESPLDHPDRPDLPARLRDALLAADFTVGGVSALLGASARGTGT